MDPSALETLRGRWHTDAPRYTDCEMVFHAERVVFHGVGGESAVYTLADVTRRTEGGRVFIEVTYRGADRMEYAMTLVHEDGPRGGVLYSPHQPEVRWFRPSAGAD